MGDDAATAAVMAVKGKDDVFLVSPRENAGCVSKLLFTWLWGLFRLGARRDLDLSDLYRIEREDESGRLGDALGREWLKETNKKNKKPSLLKAILRVFGPWYAFLGTFALIEECVCKIAQPLFLGYLIRFFGGEFQKLDLNGNDVNWYYGYLFAAGLLAGSMLYTMMHHPFFFSTQHCGMRIRVAVSSLIYRKSLRLSQGSLGETTIGQLVNLLSNDVNRFDLCTGMLHYVWIGPLQLSIVAYILQGYFGWWPCLAGVALLVLFVPFQSQMGRLFGKLRSQVARRTDNRVRFMNEIISAMRVIKMYTWEGPFAKLVAEAREDEVRYIKRTAVLRAVNLSFYYISSKVIVFVTLLTYVLTSPDSFLTAEKVFVTLSLYNSVRLIMTLFFPNAVSNLAEVLVSIKRLQEFLLLHEREPMTTQNLSTSDRTDDTLVKIDRATASWTADGDPTLSDVTLEVKRGQLVAVIGTIGAGKGSLLQLLLGELPLSSGTCSVGGRVAYTSQEPWIFGGSVRENILFGSEFNEDKYAKVIRACALERDLQLLPFGDRTLVGDRGTSLSGGQKARVNLARAVYYDADVYLLDDPLSAVDAEVGRHLYEECIEGYLKDKARVLVTHQLQFLKSADQIVLLDKGHVTSQGSYTHLLSSGINFALLLNSATEEHSSSNASSSSSDDKKNLKTLQQQHLKYKGTGMEVLHEHSKKFKRSASTSLLEVGVTTSGGGGGSSAGLVEEFQWEEEPEVVRSLGHNYSRRMSRPVVPSLLQARNSKKNGKNKKDSKKCDESTPLLLATPKQRDEDMSSGEIGFKLYWEYVRAGSSIAGVVNLVVSNVLVQVLFSGSDYFLQYWTSREEVLQDKKNNVFNETMSGDDGGGSSFGNSRDLQVIVYSSLVGALFVVSLIRTAGFLVMCLNSSIKLHSMLFNGVLRAPMRFFEVNPVGRVLNRFAKDCGTIDETLPPTIFDTMDVALQFFGVVAIVSTVNVWLLIPSALLGIIFKYIRAFYLKTARSIKRLEGISRSPVFSHLSTSLYGLTTIRAFRAEDQFARAFDRHQDVHSASFFLFLATARWLGILVDWLSVTYIASVAFSFLVFNKGGSAVGLAVSSAMTLTGMFQWGVRQSAETENHMVSVERVLQYARLEPEAPLNSNNRPSRSWPLRGRITFKDVSLSYDDDDSSNEADDESSGSSLVLRRVNLVVEGREKVGIVGRTGAGKSSLISALFRIREPLAGSAIEIDGVDVLKIGLHELRAKISIIPQDPVLFIGTLRRNLDPFDDFDDDLLWDALEEVHLKETVVNTLPLGLEAKIAEGGSNFSVGQRQLICLARAVLRRNRILVLDEATANVDPETDALIQRTIREKFADCTVLTVAHRLHTVMDSDRILVLDGGQVKEFDEPYKLLIDTRSALHKLVQQTGHNTAQALLNIAKISHDERCNKRSAGSRKTSTSSSAAAILMDSVVEEQVFFNNE